MRGIRTIGKRVRRDMARMISRIGTPVLLTYEAADPGVAVEDRSWLEEEAPETGATLTLEVKALVHFVAPESVVQRGFTEIKSGDVIVDFGYDRDLSLYRNVRYSIKGVAYQQKNVGRDLAESWDVLIGGVATTNTILLEPAK